MEIRHLEYFLAVARYHSFSRASYAIHVSQPTLSRTISELEAELGMPLFRRTSRFVELTAYGEKFSLKAAETVNSFHSLINMKPKGSEKELVGRIYIGIPPITAATSFAKILGAFKEAYPHIDISLFEQGPKSIEKQLKTGLLDFGIFLPNDHQHYDWLWFDQDLHGIIMRKDHPLAQKDVLTYENLRDARLIIYNSDYLVHDQLLDGFGEKGISPHIVFETIEQELMLALVEENYGVAVLPRKACAIVTRVRQELTARPLRDPRLKMNLALVKKKDRTLSPEATVFLAFFKKRLEESGFRYREEGIGTD